MLSHKILTRQDIGKVANYYEDSADDYYAKDGEAITWQGKGADLLKLTDQEFDSNVFKRLLNGEVTKDDNIRRATRHDSKSRIGIDFTFSAPKSVSIQGLVCLDERVIAAHDKAVQATLAIAEQAAQTRHKRQGKSYVEDTGNLIIAKFRHETSRAQDPQLHTHAVIMNLTSRKDGQWRALKNDNIIKMTKYLGAVYRTELAAALSDIGYDIREERAGNFELAHISRAQITEFSKRSGDIEQQLSQQGSNRITASSPQKQQVTLKTRKAKQTIERQILLNDWQAQAKLLGIELNTTKYQPTVKIKDTVSNNIKQAQKMEAAKLAVRYAINHLIERQAVITRSLLLDTAIKQSVGAAAKLRDIELEISRLIKNGQLVQEEALYHPADYQTSQQQVQNTQSYINQQTIVGKSKQQAFAEVMQMIKQGELIAAEARYTTPKAINYEQQILTAERQGRTTAVPVAHASQVQLALQNTDLNAGQQAAVSLILSSHNSIVGVQGLAGTGKSHMLKTAKQLIEQHGYSICAVASYSSQVKELGKLGVKAITLASFLHGGGKEIDNKTILIIDEAGVVPAKQMAAAVSIVTKARGRLVLIGDIAQTKAIEAGRPFAQLQAHGMVTAQMDQIQRQRDAKLKTAVELAAVGKVVDSLQHINQIIEIKAAEARWQNIADDYAKLDDKLRTATIIVTGTNEAKNSINDKVRHNLDLADKGIICAMLVRRDNTAEQLKYAKNYEIGDIIKPEHDYAKSGLQSSELYRIVDKGNGNKLLVSSLSTNNKHNTNHPQELIEFSPMSHRKLSVYEAVENELSVGDIVKVTRQDKNIAVTTGQRFTVAVVSATTITFNSPEQQLSLSVNKPMYIDYAYASTVHSSQGMSCEQTLFDINTKSLTTAKDIYYVGISRAKQTTIIYTDNKDRLNRAIGRDNIKDAALDIKTNSTNSYNQYSRIEKLDYESER